MENKVESITRAVVDTIKLIARNILRGRLIAARLSKIGSIEADIKASQESVVMADKRVAEAKKHLAVSEYDKTKLDANHPLFAEMTKSQDEAIASDKKYLESTEADAKAVKAASERDIAAYNKEIAEQNDGIAKIEKGETKVSKEDLAELTDKLLMEHGREAVRNL